MMNKKMDRRKFIRTSTLTAGALSVSLPGITAKYHDAAKDIKIGMIGLDTSHSPAFAKTINDPANLKMQGFKVAYAYPYGSSAIESSASRIPQYTTEIKTLGVQVIDNLQSMIAASDVVMLMTNDGTLHLEQILPVLQAKKAVFVDKPVAARLSDVLKIYDAVQKYNVPMFSSSPLRYLEGAQRVRY
ncbi:MAG TPA: Gfo/Idh/MocA family oxidoreductase, partial [Chryseolinea sp.]|nr:Gfo/Idh/MocA family oxidoreductase [Chryseolinea sp.]